MSQPRSGNSFSEALMQSASLRRTCTSFGLLTWASLFLTLVCMPPHTERIRSPSPRFGDVAFLHGRILSHSTSSSHSPIFSNSHRLSHSLMISHSFTQFASLTRPDSLTQSQALTHSPNLLRGLILSPALIQLS
ncbi:hypothetical protein BaRGS_00015411 [Batillaria attramentaria]|uniref:Uncharacterized protein n=1 Tax=Batillaria attramentaria TaxID=370345 RepID=A0ABD0L2D0_9CAEN